MKSFKSICAAAASIAALVFTSARAATLSLGDATISGDQKMGEAWVYPYFRLPEPIDFAGISALSVGFCLRETVNTLEVGDLILVGTR